MRMDSQGENCLPRNSAFGPLEEDQDSPEGQILQGYQVGKGEESGEKDFRGSFLR